MLAVGASQFCKCGGWSPPHLQNWDFNLQKWRGYWQEGAAKAKPFPPGFCLIRTFRDAARSGI